MSSFILPSTTFLVALFGYSVNLKMSLLFIIIYKKYIYLWQWLNKWVLSLNMFLCMIWIEKSQLYSDSKITKLLQKFTELWLQM